MEKIILYGIPNCDISKKARAWLTDKTVAFVFHDYKKQGISKDKLKSWCDKTGWEKLLNKKSTTWRSLAIQQQEGITGEASAIKIMMESNSIIKRPVIEFGDRLLVGFHEEDYSKQLKIKK